MNEEPNSETKFIAVFHAQHPGTGDAVPVVRAVNDETTVAELIDWHRRKCSSSRFWRKSWVDVRILPLSE